MLYVTAEHLRQVVASVRVMAHPGSQFVHTSLLQGCPASQNNMTVLQNITSISTAKTSALPSYTAATTRPDHWGIIASYVPVASYTSLCLTSRTLHAHFAPRLWNDPLRMVQLLGLDRNEELNWYLRRFIGESVKVAREHIRALVLALDFRDFATYTAEFFSWAVEEALDRTLRQLPALFPRLRCLLLDGHPAFNPASLTRVADTAKATRQRNTYLPTYKPLLLSIAGSNTELQASYFASEYTRDLVYLDISHMPGSLRTPANAGLFGSRSLPNLRVLKARGRELDDAGVKALCTAFGRQLWSLDVCENKMTDAGLDSIITHCMPARSLLSDSRYDIEGKAIIGKEAGPSEGGPFVTIVESGLSASFIHPERHFADPPAYISSENLVQRPSGAAPVMRDDLDDMLLFLAGGAGQDIAPEMVEELTESRRCRSSGLSHLAISGNQVTQAGVERMLCLSRGALEHFDCDLSLMRTRLPWTSKQSYQQSCLYSLIGSTYLFRPVISSSLRSLRVHHSLVTQIPTVDRKQGIKASSLGDTWQAEKLLMPRASLAWPDDGFVPDTNPRLTSLTLTNLPRRSAGPIVNKLKDFFVLLYEQQNNINNMRRALSGGIVSRRSPIMLTGIRHLRLEFDSIPETGDADITGSGIVYFVPDVEIVKNAPPADFSFFGTWAPETTAAQVEIPRHPSPNLHLSEECRPQPPPPPPPPHSQSGESMAREPAPTQPLSQDTDSAPCPAVPPTPSTAQTTVWVGPGCSSSDHPAVTEYVRNIKEQPRLRAAVGPATPPQVRAGVPSGVHLFQAAWEATLLAALETTEPGTQRGGMQDPALGLMRLRMPTNIEVGAMVDVVDELKRFRAGERAAGRHWTGTLEVINMNKAAAATESGFWR